MDPALRYHALKLQAIEAIAGGRFPQADVILRELLQARPIQRGVCRMCGCSEASACAILVPQADILSPFVEPRVERCSWADEDCTICTNVSCLERWRKEAPAEMDVDLHDASVLAAATSRLVRP